MRGEKSSKRGSGESLTDTSSPRACKDVSFSSFSMMMDGEGAGREMWGTIPPQLLEHMMQMLDPRSLCACNGVSKGWRKLASACKVWHSLCQIRWKIRTPIWRSRVYGDKRWIKIYQKLSQKKRMPKGTYTGNRARAFAFGRTNGIDVWVTVAHRPDCALLRTKASTSENRLICLRVSVQNTHHQELLLPTNPLDLHLMIRTKNGLLLPALLGESKESDPEFSHLPKSLIISEDTPGDTVSPRIVAFNGNKVQRSPGEGVRLGPLGFAVIEAKFDARFLRFEPEFLEQCSSLHLCAIACNTAQSQTPDTNNYSRLHPHSLSLSQSLQCLPSPSHRLFPHPCPGDPSPYPPPYSPYDSKDSCSTDASNTDEDWPPSRPNSLEISRDGLSRVSDESLISRSSSASSSRGNVRYPREQRGGSKPFSAGISAARFYANTKGCLAKTFRPIVADVEFFHQGDIWKHYSTLPGGFMYLNDLNVIKHQERSDNGFL